MPSDEPLRQPPRDANGDTKGQTYEQVAAASEQAIRNLVGVPISLREFEEAKINNVEREIQQFREEIFHILSARSDEWNKSFEAHRDTRELALGAVRETVARIEETLRREIGQAADLRTQELRAVADQIETVRKQVDDRDIANKEAVTKAEVAATTAIAAAANTTATAVTKAETAATNAIVQAAEATKSAIGGVKEGFEQKITTLRDKFDVYTSQHKEVHDNEHVAADKFEAQSAEWARALTEFQRSSERAGESFVKREALDDMRRALEQQISALEKTQNTSSGREGASTQYAGVMLSVLLALMAVGVSVALALTR